MGIEHKVKARQALSEFYLTRGSNRMYIYITNTNQILHIIPEWIIIWIYFNNSFTTFLLTILLAQNVRSFWGF